MNLFPVVRCLAACALLAWAGSGFADELQDARLLLKQGQRGQAEQRVDAYIARHPGDSQGRFLKGIILSEQNRVPEAIEIFRALTQEFPELPEPYNNLAVLYAAQGKIELARGTLEMAVRAHPEYATAHENLGDVYLKLAALAYERAAQLDRSSPSAQGKLGRLKDLLPAPAPVAAAPAAPTAR